MRYIQIVFLLFFVVSILGWIAYKCLLSAKDPDFSIINVENYETGQSVSLASLQGKVTIIAFFQTWCSDCIREMPTLLKLENQIPTTDIKIIMVTDEPKEKISAFKNRFPNFKFEYYISQKRLPEIGIKRYPTTYLLDSQGNIKLRTFEGYDWSTTQSVEIIAALLK